MSTKTIALIGEVSSGKSSLLNSFACGFISCVSLQRETFQPLWYQFSKSGHIKNITSISIDLDNVHKNNLKNRESLTNTKDNLEEKISTLNKICDDFKKLPVMHGLEDFNLIDFPGLNDSEDKNNNFFKAVQNRISGIDMIIYVTDASRAFVSTSELDQFKKIKNLVKKEEDENDHLVDFIIVVNKFDNVEDEDLNEIYDRIGKKTELSKEKIFRISSHRMLVSGLIKQKVNLYVPEFMRKSEMGKILQNADVSTKNIINKIKEKGIISYDDLVSNEIITNKFVGDWDGMMLYLKKFPKNYHDYQLKMIENKLNVWKIKCMEIYDGANGYNVFYLSSLSSLSRDEEKHGQLINDLLKYHNKISPFGSFGQDIFNNFFIGVIEEIIKKYSANKTIVRIFLLEIPFDKIITDFFKRRELMKIISASEYLSYQTLILSFYQNIMYFEIYVNSNYKLFSKKETFNELKFEIYRTDDKKWYSGYGLIKGKYNHKSWFINNLLNGQKTSNDLRQILILSTTPIKYLRLYQTKGLIPQDILIKIDPSLPVKFEYLVHNSDPNSILEHKLFDYNNEELIKYYDNYTNFLDVFKINISKQKETKSSITSNNKNNDEDILEETKPKTKKNKKKIVQKKSSSHTSNDSQYSLDETNSDLEDLIQY